MHVPRIEVRSLDETAEAVDLGQTPADAVFLSFSDSDLNALAAAYEVEPEPKPTLRLASLAALRHPYAIDLYLETVCTKAKLIVARILGGADYWRYGVDELAALARRRAVKLALLPGDRRPDARLAEASTLPPESAAEIWRYFDEGGGPDNMAGALAFVAAEVGFGRRVPPPRPVEAFGKFERASFDSARAPHALIVFYRSVYLANDVAPIEALAAALHERDFATTSVYVTSLKHEAAIAPLRALIARRSFDVVINATAFSARLDESGGTILDSIDAPVLQVVLAGVGIEAWRASPRGLSPADLAMHVALPEIDGRILSRAVSFKARHATETRDGVRRGSVHAPMADRVAFVADLAASWARLRRKPAAEKRLACVLPDYPAKADGRATRSVSTPPRAPPPSPTCCAPRAMTTGASDAPGADRALSQGPLGPALCLPTMRPNFAAAPEGFRPLSRSRVGRARKRSERERRRLPFPLRAAGRLIVAVQPDRGDRSVRARATTTTSPSPPRHAYVAFYIWLREVERIDALIHLGAHGTLEWLPGKAVALVEGLRAEATLGPAAGDLSLHRQQSRRSRAGQAPDRRRHDRPSDAAAGRAGAHGAAHELGSAVRRIRRRRRRSIRAARAPSPDLILERGRRGGAASRNAPPRADRRTRRSSKLDAWLCDLKDMRIGDGLHVFGRSPESVEGFAAEARARRRSAPRRLPRASPPAGPPSCSA